MIQSKRVSKIVNILILITLITTMFFTGSVVAEVDVPTNEPEQTIEPSEDTNLQVATTDVKQLPAGQAEYTEEYYYEQLDGSYLLVKTEIKVGTIGATVIMNTSLDTEFWKSLAVGNPELFYGFNYVASSSTSRTGIVKEDGSLVLSMRVARSSVHFIIYDYQSVLSQRFVVKYGASYTMPEPPNREGCQFSHWVFFPLFAREAARPSQIQSTATGCETIINNSSLGTYAVFEVGVHDNWTVKMMDSMYWPIYVTAPPTPTPVTTPTPEPVTVPTPNPGRTCQDDGYADGYTWNGTACVLLQDYIVPNTAVK